MSIQYSLKKRTSDALNNFIFVFTFTTKRGKGPRGEIVDGCSMAHGKRQIGVGYLIQIFVQFVRKGPLTQFNSITNERQQDIYRYRQQINGFKMCRYHTYIK